MEVVTIGQRGHTAAVMIGRLLEATSAAMAVAMTVRHTLTGGMEIEGMIAAIPGSMTVAMTGDTLLQAMGKSYQVNCVDYTCMYFLIILLSSSILQLSSARTAAHHIRVAF